MNSSKNYLNTTIKGGGLLILGVVGTTILQFIAGIITIRLLDTVNFGYIALSIVVCNLVANISTLGIESGIPYLHAEYLSLDGGEGREKDLTGIGSALYVVFLSGLLLTLFFGIYADNIALFFTKPDSGKVIFCFSFAVIPLGISLIITAYYRAIKEVKPKVIFQDILPISTRIVLLLIACAFSKITVINVAIIFVVSYWFSTLVYLLRLMRDLNIRFFRFDIISAYNTVQFSIPLMGKVINSSMMNWFPTLIIGYFCLSSDVGLFSASSRLAKVIQIPLNALAFIFLPIMVMLVRENGQADVKRYYLTLSKWCTVLILPLVFFFVYYPNFILIALFGQEYAEASTVFRLLVTSFAIHSLFGFNGTTLIAYGENKIVFKCTILAGVCLVLFSVLLVNIWGVEGVAVAFLTATSIANIFLSVQLYNKFKIPPFSFENIKPIIVFAVMSLIISLTMKILFHDSTLGIMLVFVLFVIAGVLSLFIAKSISEDDIHVLRAIELKLFKKTLLVDLLSKKNMPVM